MAHTFTCHGCGGVFEADEEDNERAAAECLEVFGMPHQPDDAVLCTECYEQLLREGDRRGLPRKVCQ